MDDLLKAYNAGRADGTAGRRDNDRSENPETGADYRIGFLDGRIAVFKMLAEARKFLGED